MNRTPTVQTTKGTTNPFQHAFSFNSQRHSTQLSSNDSTIIKQIQLTIQFQVLYIQPKLPKLAQRRSTESSDSHIKKTINNNMNNDK